MVKLATFAPGDRVRPTSGPYRRTEFEVVGVEGDRVSVKSEKLKLVFPAKNLKLAPKPKAKAIDYRSKPATDIETPLSDSDLELIDKAWERHKAARPYDPNAILDQYGFTLSVGDRVTNALPSGKFVHYGIIEAFGGTTEINVRGRWIEGRREDEGTDRFSVPPDQLIKVPKDGAWSPWEKTAGHQAIPSEDSIKPGDRVQSRFLNGAKGTVKATRQWNGTRQISFAIVVWDEIQNPELKTLAYRESEVSFNSLTLIGAGIEPTHQAFSAQNFIKVGDRVSFQTYWWGGMRDFEGEVVKLGDPEGTALVNYYVPTAEDGEQLKELQAPIGIFAKAKIPELTPAMSRTEAEKVPPEEEIAAEVKSTLLGAPSAETTIAHLEDEIARIEKEGNVALVGCSIEVYTASSGTSQHVRYSARKPIFQGKRSGGMVCKSAIGKKNSPEHQQAEEAIARRNRIQALRRQIKALGGD